jgi:hypothetical protein
VGLAKAREDCGVEEILMLVLWGGSAILATLFPLCSLNVGVLFYLG